MLVISVPSCKRHHSCTATNSECVKLEEIQPMPCMSNKTHSRWYFIGLEDILPVKLHSMGRTHITLSTSCLQFTTPTVTMPREYRALAITVSSCDGHHSCTDMNSASNSKHRSESSICMSNKTHTGCEFIGIEEILSLNCPSMGRMHTMSLPKLFTKTVTTV